MKALDNLIAQRASPLPKKISFNAPPELALELLEVYYRIHATILKLEFADGDFPPTWERLGALDTFLQKVERLNIVSADPRSSKEDKSVLSETDATMSMLEPPPAKVMKLDVDADVADKSDAESLESAWDAIAQRCIKSLEIVVNKFQQHFKAIHALSVYYLKSKKNKDIRKVQRLIWGSETAATTPAPASNAANNKSVSLFGERKSNNLFNGIWRLPNSEFDRAGNFSTHMAKCTNTLLEMASQIKDQQVRLFRGTLTMKISKPCFAKTLN